MSDNILVKAILLHSDANVIVSDIRIGLTCIKCGHAWGIKVDISKDLIAQADRFVCMLCHKNRLNEQLGMYDEKNIGINSGHTKE